MKDRQKVYEKFLAKSPTIEDFEAALRKYKRIEEEIGELPNCVAVAALSLDFTAVKDALLSEALAWKQFFGERLKLKSHQEMTELGTFFDEATMKLNRQVVRSKNCLAPIDLPYVGV